MPGPLDRFVVSHDGNPEVVTIGGALSVGAVVLPSFFGIPINGAEESSTLFNAMLEQLPAGTTVDLAGHTYVFTSPFVYAAARRGITVQNGKIDLSGCANNDECFQITGTRNAPLTISSDPAVDDKVITGISSTATLAAGDWVWIESADLWDNWDDFCVCGEMQQIKSVDSLTQVTLMGAIMCAMATTVTLRKLNLVEDFTLRSVELLGSGAGASGLQVGIKADYVRNLLIEGCVITKFDVAAVRLNQCLGTVVHGGTIGYANATALSYGLQQTNGCFSTHVSAVTFVDVRHGVDHGDNGGPNRASTITANVFYGCREAAISTHTAADQVVISDNVIFCSDKASTLASGILSRGANTTITGNRIVAPGGNGIEVRVNVTAVKAHFTIANNSVERVYNLYGIMFKVQTSGGAGRVVIIGNSVKNSASVAANVGIWVDAADANIDDVLVNGNVVVDFLTGIRVHAEGVTIIQAANIVGNILDMADLATVGIRVSAAADGNLQNVTVGNNQVLNNPATGLLGINEENLVAIGNRLIGCATPISVTATKQLLSNLTA